MRNKSQLGTGLLLVPRGSLTSQRCRLRQAFPLQVVKKLTVSTPRFGVGPYSLQCCRCSGLRGLQGQAERPVVGRHNPIPRGSRGRARVSSTPQLQSLLDQQLEVVHLLGKGVSGNDPGRLFWGMAAFQATQAGAELLVLRKLPRKQCFLLSLGPQRGHPLVQLCRGRDPRKIGQFTAPGLPVGSSCGHRSYLGFHICVASDRSLFRSLFD